MRLRRLPDAGGSWWQRDRFDSGEPLGESEAGQVARGDKLPPSLFEEDGKLSRYLGPSEYALRIMPSLLLVDRDRLSLAVWRSESDGL